MQQEFDMNLYPNCPSLADTPDLEMSGESDYEASGEDNADVEFVTFKTPERPRVDDNLPAKSRGPMTAAVHPSAVSANVTQDDSESMPIVDAIVGVGYRTNTAPSKEDSGSHGEKRCNTLSNQPTASTEDTTIQNTPVEEFNSIFKRMADTEILNAHSGLNFSVSDEDENQSTGIKDAQNAATSQDSGIGMISEMERHIEIPHEASNSCNIGRRDDMIKEDSRHMPREPPAGKGLGLPNKAAFFLQGFPWYLRFDIAAPQDCKADDPHTMLLELEERIHHLCRFIVQDASGSALRLYKWRTLFVRCGEEATKSQSSLQDFGTFLVGIQLAEEPDINLHNFMATVSGEQKTRYPRPASKHFSDGCDPLRETAPFRATHTCIICTKWGERIKTWLLVFEEQVRLSATFRKCQATNSLTAIMARLVGQKHLGPLILDEWVWGAKDRYPIKYEYGSLPTVTGHSWNRDNAVVARLSNPVDPRPFQAVARILHDHREYSKEWASYLCGFYDAQGFKEITLEYWLACRPNLPGHVHIKTCRRRRKKTEGPHSGISSQCWPNAGDMVSVRRHKTLEMMWHRTLGIDKILRPGSISNAGLPGVPFDLKRAGTEGQSKILQRAKLFCKQIWSRLFGRRKGAASAYTGLQTKASQPNQA